MSFPAAQVRFMGQYCFNFQIPSESVRKKSWDAMISYPWLTEVDRGQVLLS